MQKNHGSYKENRKIFELDGAKIKDLNKQNRYLLRILFGELDDEETIRCETLDNFFKPDFYVIYKGVRKNVSFKTGRSSSIHQEHISTVIDFLKKEGMSDEAIKYFKLFFYRDDTLDGSGENKKHIIDMVEANMEKAELLNQELNNSKEFVKRFIYRILFKGREEDNPEVDYICYWRDEKCPYVIGKKQMMKYIEQKNWDYMDNPHIGPIQFRPHQLYKNGNEFHDKYIHRVDCWWSNFVADLEYIDRYFAK